MISSTALLLTGSVLISLATGQNNPDPQLTGTWSSKSRKVLTGPVRSIFGLSLDHSCVCCMKSLFGVSSFLRRFKCHIVYTHTVSLCLASIHRRQRESHIPGKTRTLFLDWEPRTRNRPWEGVIRIHDRDQYDTISECPITNSHYCRVSTTQ